MTRELDELLNREWDGVLAPAEAERLDALCQGDEGARRRREEHRSLREAFASFPDETPDGLADRIADRVLAAEPIEMSAWTRWGRSVARAAVVLICFGIVGIAAFQIGSNTTVTATTSEHELARTRFLESLESQKPLLQKELQCDAATAERVVNLRLRFWELARELRQEGASADELRELFLDEEAAILRLLSPQQRELWRRQAQKTSEEIENLLRRAPR